MFSHFSSASFTGRLFILKSFGLPYNEQLSILLKKHPPCPLAPPCSDAEAMAQASKAKAARGRHGTKPAPQGGITTSKLLSYYSLFLIFDSGVLLLYLA